MIDTKQTNTDYLGAYKAETFQAYALWRSMPVFLKVPPVDGRSGTRPSVEEYLRGIGIDDQQTIQLAGLRFQKDFAERFSVDEDTLTRWNKKLNDGDPLEDIKKWARNLSKNMVSAMHNHYVKDGSAQNAKLWFQLVHDWKEKQEQHHHYEGVTEFNINVRKNANKLGTDGEASPSVGTPDGQ